mgnify:CR=1 FL=1
MTVITPNTILLPINKENDDSYGEAENEELLRRGWSKRRDKKFKRDPKTEANA